MEHKEKLRTIFPYVLGAVTPELLARRWEIEQLSRELRRKDRELDAQRQSSIRWKTELRNWVSEARDLGLVPPSAITSDMTDDDVLLQLEAVVKKTSGDAQITEDLVTDAAIEASSLDTEEGAISLELATSQVTRRQYDQASIGGRRLYRSKPCQRDRLELSSVFLRPQAETHQATCPICGGAFEDANRELNVLCDALATLEATTRRLDPVPAVFDRELVQVREQARLLSERLKGVRTRRDALEARSTRIRDERWSRGSIDRFIGRMEQALQVLKAPADGGPCAFAQEVADLKARLEELRALASDGNARERQRAALQRVSAAMARFLPLLDTERPNDPAELNVDDLTIRVTGSSGRPDFLWDIGSGANWLSYHVAAMLGLHELWALVRPEKSRPESARTRSAESVHFLRKAAGRPMDDGDGTLADEDVTAVRKVFDVLGATVKGNTWAAPNTRS